MAKSIDISVATQLATGSYIQVSVSIQENGVSTALPNYSFNANDFTCVYDSLQPNIAVFHFGANHTLSVSNGDYSVFSWGGTSKTSVIDLAAAVVTDIAQYTT